MELTPDQERDCVAKLRLWGGLWTYPDFGVVGAVDHGGLHALMEELERRGVVVREERVSRPSRDGPRHRRVWWQLA